MTKLHVLTLAAVLMLTAADAPVRARAKAAVASLSADDARLAELLDEARRRAEEYESVFKDSTAEETKTIEFFDDEGGVERSRRVISDLIAYDLDDKGAAEFRNVFSVDGKPVKRRDERALELLNRLGKEGSVAERLERINREGTRFDPDMRFTGLVMLQAVPLVPRLRRDIVFRTPLAAEPLVIFRHTFDYRASEFGVLLPRRIVIDFFRLRRGADGAPAGVLDKRATFEYGEFKRFRVSAREAVEQD